MHEAALAEAALPAPTIILGLTMRQYSLGHELWLIRQGNPLIVGDTVAPEHVREAALICCHSWLGVMAMNKDWLIRLKLKIWRWRIRKVNSMEAAAAFQKYRKLGALEFPISDTIKPSSGSPSRQPGSPFLIRLMQFLVLKMRKSEVEAWDYPLGLAKMQYAAYWESEGALDVYNDHDASFDKFMEEQEALCRA